MVRPGAFVRCAVTGLPIPLEELKYWSVDLQEAYLNPERSCGPDRDDARPCRREMTESPGDRPP